MFDVDKWQCVPLTKREYREYLIGLIDVTSKMHNRTLLFEAMKELYRIDSEDGE